MRKTPFAAVPPAESSLVGGADPDFYFPPARERKTGSRVLGFLPGLRGLRRALGAFRR